MSDNKTPVSEIVKKLRKGLLSARLHYLRKVWGMDIGPGARISTGARLDKAFPQGVHIGQDTGVADSALILSHDFVKSEHRHTYVGKNCHIGAKAVILPGVRIGNSCIVAPASVVMKDVPDGCLVSGNPARIIEKGLELGPWGIREWDGIR